MRCAIVLLLLTTELLAAAPKVRKDHPRIYVTKADVPVIRAKCAGPMKDVFTAMKKADWIMSRKAGTGWTDRTNVAYPAFMYLVTSEKKYLNKTKEFLDALSRNWPKNQYLTPEWLRGGAMAADWIWNDLTPAERAKYGRTLLDMSDWVLKKVWRHSDFNNHFVGEHLAVLYVAVLLDGENIEPARTKKLMKTGMDYLLNHAVPAANEIAGRRYFNQSRKVVRYERYFAQFPKRSFFDAFFVGGQPEGFSYNDWGYARPLALTCEMWRVATGQDLFKDSSFFRGQSVWHAYGLRPDTGTFARSEDCSSGFKPGANLKTFMHLLATRLDDPLAEWLAEKHKWKYVQGGWKEILWRNPKLKARSPKQMSLPLAACFPKLGHVYFRTSWDNKDSAFALFQCGPYYAGHQHLDNNTFVIHRSGSLAIDSGTNDYGSHRGNYYCRTIAHNGILVFDPAEKFSGRAWSARGSGGSNDGGQVRGKGQDRVGKFKPGCESDIGKIIAFKTGRYCAAAVGDATKSYSPAKVSKAIRAFYHLRPGTPGPEAIDTFVVFDRVETKKPGAEAKWVIHSLDKPKIDGDQFIITHSGGQLIGEVLLPVKPKMEIIGGPGKESFVSGRNYPPTKKKPDAEHGSWRIEMSFKGQALVLLTVAKNDIKPAAIRSAAPMGTKPGFTFTRGRLRYDLLLSKAGIALPIVEIRQDGKIVETLRLVP
ncbi:MAG: heparinase II/III family protein [Phycisphaerae bacterium]|nr:heparinase II/III family protein [Phycisphaerae bacterium]